MLDDSFISNQDTDSISGSVPRSGNVKHYLFPNGNPDNPWHRYRLDEVDMTGQPETEDAGLLQPNNIMSSPSMTYELERKQKRLDEIAVIAIPAMTADIRNYRDMLQVYYRATTDLAAEIFYTLWDIDEVVRGREPKHHENRYLGLREIPAVVTAVQPNTVNDKQGTAE